MIGKKTLETNPIPMANVKKILEDFSQEYELDYEQNLTLDHVTKFSKLPLEETEKLIDALEEKVKRKVAIRIADILPEDLADLRLLFAKERIVVKKEDMQGILDIVDGFR
ncbi:MAG: RNA polymerase Rpb4 family protein [Methanobrevibacter sp.]|jgi:DNA-directed RNA polymerase subunit F|nr:RNA polymerase Rpb4 family protein [Methanobrevibacter sp.]